MMQASKCIGLQNMNYGKKCIEAKAYSSIVYGTTQNKPLVILICVRKNKHFSVTSVNIGGELYVYNFRVLKVETHFSHESMLFLFNILHGGHRVEIT